MDFLVIQWFTFGSYYWCCWRSAFHWLQTFPCKWIKRLKVWKAVKMFSLPKFLVCTTKGRTYNFIYTWLGDKKSSYVSSCGKVLCAVKIGFLRVLFPFLFLSFLQPHPIRSICSRPPTTPLKMFCCPGVLSSMLTLVAGKRVSFLFLENSHSQTISSTSSVLTRHGFHGKASFYHWNGNRLFWCLCRTLEMVGHSYSSSTHCCNIAKVSLDSINTSSDSFWQCPACIRALCCR